jgi:site-specific recombinase XerD
MGGYRASTQRNYNSAWRIWGDYINSSEIPLESLKQQEVAESVFLEFLETLVNKKDMSTSTFLTIRSAVSSLFRIVFSRAFGDNYQAQLMARKIRNEKPRKLKHHKVFDIALLIHHYRTMRDNTQLSDQDLQAKVATMLIAFIQLRPQDMLRLDMTHLEETKNGLFFGSVIKNAPEFSECILSFVEEPLVCPVRAVLELWRRVRNNRPDATVLFWNEGYSQPVTKVQLERIMKNLMMEAGVPDTYTPYSITHAAITHLLANDVPEWMVNKNARLSQFTNTSTRHYFVGQANYIVSKAIANADHSAGERVSSTVLMLLPPDQTTNDEVHITEKEEEIEEEEKEEEEEEEAEKEDQEVQEVDKKVEKQLAERFMTDEEGSIDIDQDSQNLTQLWLDNIPCNIAQKTFVFDSDDRDGMETIPSITYDSSVGDFPLFMSVCSVLSTFASGDGSAMHDSGRRVTRQGERGQLAGSVCSSHAGHRSHSPDQPPLSPNSGSLSQ